MKDLHISEYIHKDGFMRGRLPVLSPFLKSPLTLTLPLALVKTVIIGGAEDKEQDKTILSTVLQAAGGTQARLLIIPTASGEPEILGEIYRLLFTQMGCATAQVLNLTNRFQADTPEMEKLLREATGVFLTGGDQVRLATILAHTRFTQILKSLWQTNQVVIAGTSAGASALGTCMIGWGTSSESPRSAIVELSTGLGFLPSLIIDQHFFNRNRLARLITAVTANPMCLGLGIDENTAVALTPDGLLEVLGEGSVTIVDAAQLSHRYLPPQEEAPLSVCDLKLHILVQGAQYQIQQRRLVLA